MEDKNFNCPICYDIVDDAMECGKCCNIFCRKCVVSLTSCSMCRTQIVFKESHFANKLIGGLPYDCPNQCGISLKRNEKKRHLESCLKRRYECNRCSFESEREAFLSHIVESHSEQLIKSFILVESPSIVMEADSIFYHLTVSSENGNYSEFDFVRLARGLKDLYTRNKQNDHLLVDFGKRVKVSCMSLRAPFTGGGDHRNIENAYVEILEGDSLIEGKWERIFKIENVNNTDEKTFQVNRNVRYLRIILDEYRSGFCLGVGKLNFK